MSRNPSEQSTTKAAPRSPRQRRWGPPLVVVLSAVLAWGAVGAGEEEPRREEVEVRATRLPDRPDPETDVPAHVTVLDRDDVDRSPAATVQDLLAVESGVLLIDTVGNGVQQTVDLRGFTRGRGTAVYLDGVRLNDPGNDRAALDLVPVDALERIVLLRGSGAAQAGGGSQAGALHLDLRRGERLDGEIETAVGTDGATRVRGSAGAGLGRFDLFVSALSDTTDGFRENSASDRAGATVTAGIDLGNGRRAGLSLLASETEAGTPGALTREEWTADPGAAPFNRLDFLDDRSTLAAAQFRGPVSRSWSVAASLSLREVDRESLVTGRVAPVFGGSFLEAATAATEAVAQATRDAAGGKHRIVAGLEWADGTDQVPRDREAARSRAAERPQPLVVRWPVGAGGEVDRRAGRTA